MFEVLMYIVLLFAFGLWLGVFSAIVTLMVCGEHDTIGKILMTLALGCITPLTLLVGACFILGGLLYAFIMAPFGEYMLPRDRQFDAGLQFV